MFFRPTSMFTFIVIFLLLIAGPALAVVFEYVPVDNNAPNRMWTKSVGDFNSDGLPDLLVLGKEGIFWYENPTWTKHQIFSGDREWNGTDTGDIDKDGDIDIVTGSYSQHDIYWLENPGGDGTGIWTIYKIGNEPPDATYLYDIDNDGDLDIINRGKGQTYFDIWRQEDPYTWTRFRTYHNEGGEHCNIGDLDKDGDMDVVVGGSWYENPGFISNNWSEHTFTTAWTENNVYPYVGDLNGDERPDVVLTPTESYVCQYYKTAWYEGPVDPKANGWTEHIIENNIECYTHSLGVGDIDNDGDLDVMTAEMHQSINPDEVRIYLNEGGTGLTWTKEIVAESGSHFAHLVDIDLDGDLDIFGANHRNINSHNVDLWVNQTDPVLSLVDWTYYEIDNSRSQRYFGLAMDNLTSDVFKDIVSGQYFYRNPNGELSQPWTRVTFPINVDALLIVNVDDDQYGDVIGMDNTGKVYWLEASDTNGSSWSYLEIGDVVDPNYMSSQGYTLGQVVLGGKQEIIINSEAGLYYFEIPDNPEAGNWPRVTVSTEPSLEGIAVGDVDKDGDIDISGSVNQRIVGWWENPGIDAGNWTRYNIGSTPSAWADRFYMADLDQDGLLDFVVSAASGSANGIYWFKCPSDPKNSDWVRTTLVNSGSANPINSMDVADMDLDGDIDIISGEHRGSERVTIWENYGLANFTPHHISSAIESHLGTRVADLDNDGDLDIVSIAWDDYQYMHLWENNAREQSDPNFLIGFWQFEEGSGSIAVDTAGNYNGTINGAAYSTDSKIGTYALDFDGSNDNVNLGTFNITGNQMTICAWFKADSFIPNWDDNRIISKASSTSEQGHYWMISTIQSGSNTRLRFRLKTSGSTTTLIANSGSVVPDVWVHGCGVYDGNNMIIYQDSVEVGRTSKSGNISSSSDSVLIGANLHYGYWDGQIDQLRIYDRALSPSEIITLYLEDSEPVNQAPQVNAGTDQSITFPNDTITLDATVTDDGLPEPPGAYTVQWSVINQPTGSAVTFANPNAEDTTATFSVPGTYVLKLTADDSELQGSDNITVYFEDPEPVNQAPQVNAGTDQSITFPNDTITLDATVTDDDLPEPPGEYTVQWSVINQPTGSAVTFANPNAEDTTATFSVPGTYVLKLTADDSELQGSDNITVTVNPDPAIDPALIGFWQFEEGSGSIAFDTAGNYDGTTNGAAYSTDSKIGTYALDFDGSNDSVNLGNFNITGNQMTICAWFKDDYFIPTWADNRIISKASSTSEQGHYWMISTIQSDNNTRLRFRLKTAGSTTTLIASSGSVVTGVWVHGCGVYDGNNMIIYQDSVEVGRTSKSGNISSSSDSVLIGANPHYGYWDGQIDQLRIYDRALSPAEIVSLYLEDSESE